MATRNTKSASRADAGKQPASGVSPEAAVEDLARKAEAVAKPGDNVDEVVQAQQVSAPKGATHAEVRARVQRGIRRGGRRWGPEKVSVPLADLSEAQLAAIEAEERLSVTYVTVEKGE